MNLLEIQVWLIMILVSMTIWAAGFKLVLGMF
jgi:hypothetical protein